MSSSVIYLWNHTRICIITFFNEAAARFVKQEMAHSHEDDSYFMVKIILASGLEDLNGNTLSFDHTEDLPIAMYEGCSEKVSDTSNFSGLSLIKTKQDNFAYTILRVPKECPRICITEYNVFKAGDSVMYRLGDNQNTGVSKANVVPINIIGNGAAISLYYSRGGGGEHDTPLFEVVKLHKAELDEGLLKSQNFKNEPKHEEQKRVSQGVLTLLSKAAGSVNIRDKAKTVSAEMSNVFVGEPAIYTETYDVTITLNWDAVDADDHFHMPYDVDDLPIAVYKGCPEKVNYSFNFPGMPLLLSRTEKQYQTVIHVPVDNPLLCLTECVSSDVGREIMYRVKPEWDVIETDVIQLVVLENNAKLSITYSWGGNDFDTPYFVLDLGKGVKLKTSLD